MSSEIFKPIICFFTKCKHRNEDGDCTFNGTIIIGIECDCQCMEPNMTQVSCSVTEKLGRR